MAENKKFVPKRRFKKFQNADAWEERKLGEVADIIGGGTPSTSNFEYWNGDIDWYSPVEIGEQIFVDGSQKKITELGLQKSSAKILPVGTVLFASRAGIGNTAILAKEGSTNQGFQSIVPNKNELDSYFVYSRTNELKRFGETNGAGSTFTEVSGKQMAKMPILIPGLEEQAKIGSFFQYLDNLITLQQCKLEKTKALKAAYLSEMFPQEGESVPKRRFAGFTGAWEQRKLGEVAKYRNGKAHENSICDNGSYVVVNSKFVSTNGKVKKYSNEQIEPLIINEIAFVLSDVPNGRAIARTYLVEETNKYTLNQRIAAITPNETTTPYFLHISMNRHPYFLQFDDGVKQTNLSKSEVENFKSFYPEKNEQDKIGSFFSHLDNLITLQQRKLEKLQNIKKAYLNEMFI